MKVYHTLKPIYNKNSKILILGSMPSVISRNKNFYYANKNNRFWKIIENLFDIKLISNAEKNEFLLKNKIALWDVIKSCNIIGSSDCSIKNVEINDISYLLNHSNIKYIFVTGKTALKFYNMYLINKTKKEAFYLPSPSSANASYSLEKLIKEYEIILQYLNQ
ncbi:MAG: DNA-deoxyinosine glycosylase [Bacilli bacterium]